MDRAKIIKMLIILAGVVVIATGLSKFMRKDSMSLTEYARLQGIPITQSPEPHSEPPAASPSPGANESAPGHPGTSVSPEPGTEPGNHFPSETPNPDANGPFTSAAPNAGGSSASASPHPETGSLDADGSSTRPGAEASSPDSNRTEDAASPSAQLTGASLNGNSQLEQRIVLEDGFYYEPLSPQLCRYITGISFPASEGAEEETKPEITLEELRYVHILHYDFDGNPTEGELICNEYIAQDLVEIFCELYRNEYQLEKVLLIDEYDGDDNASMEDNNTSCFNYRPVEGRASLSRHALGLAIDINPLYNPYITYTKTGEETVLPASAAAYADRSANFPYKIDENDLCYKLFTQHGFTWGGNWNNVKDYQHFQKAK